MEEPSRERIEETVTDILKQADMEAMTEFKVRALASEKLNFDLSSSPHLRLLIRNIVESFLLSLPPAHDVVSPPAPATTKIADNGDLIICELSKCRRVVVQDFRGKPLVSIREFYNKGGKLLPSARGISLSTEQWSAFKKNIPGIEEAIKVMQSRIGPKVDGKEAEDASNAMSACIPPSKEDGKQFENASNVMSVCIPPKEEGSVNPGIPCNKDGKQIEAESNAMGARVPPIDVESKNPIISLNEDGKQIEDASTSMTTCISPKDEEECRNADKNPEPLVNHNLNPAKKQKPDMIRPGILGKSQEPGKDKKGLVCFSCGKQGHFSRNCWSRKPGSEVGKRIDKENPSTPVTDVNMVEKVAE
ncbi:Zinc finger, CCHC-type [Dillenia turbinata]|uniref:Zinc finger, CCHC-type n=1 Tax=Dillenia turbinata TaxID=194707 RepID=A0AAN8UZT7_9MAGN